MVAIEELTDRDKEVLAFEKLTWREAGDKETEAYERFGLRWIRYYAMLNRLINSPAAEAYDPILVRRLRSQRDALAARKGRGI